MNSNTTSNSYCNDVQALIVVDSENSVKQNNNVVPGNPEGLEERSIPKEETLSNNSTIFDESTISIVSDVEIANNNDQVCEKSSSDVLVNDCPNDEGIRKDPHESVLQQSEAPRNDTDVSQIPDKIDELVTLKPDREGDTGDSTGANCENIVENASTESCDEDTISTKSDSSEDITPSSSDSSRKCFNERNARHRGTVVYHNTSEDEFMGQYDSSASILSHPVYKAMVQELASSKEQIRMCHAEIDRLETENQRLEAENSPQIYVVQLEALEKTIGQQQKDIQVLLEQKKTLEESSAKNYSLMKQDLEGKLQKITKMYEGANREKESMVVRYATSERDVIEGKKEKEALDKKIREMAKEREILLNKVKAMNGEKARICLMLDGKCNDLSEVQRENEKLKEELNLREVKLKWTQNKLKAETDYHKETKVRLDNVSQKLQSYEEEVENVRRESQEMVRAFRESQENRAFTLDQQLKEQQAQLIMERHDKEDKEGVRKVLQQEIENFKAKQKVIIEENNLLSVKVQKLEKERLEYEQNLSSQKRVVDEQRQQMADLCARLTHMESLQLQLQHEHEKVLAAQGEVERLRQNNSELQQEMSACREREAELLAFTQRLTDKNVWLQSEFSATEAKAQLLESEQEPLRKRMLELETELQRVRQSLETEHREREDENRLLARHLAERTQRVEQLERDLEDSKGELNVLKRRQAMTIKELTKELQQCHRRLETANASASGGGKAEGACNSNHPQSLMENFALASSSRASSQSSLDVREPKDPMAYHHSEREPDRGERSHSSEPSRQVLIERIVELQRNNARKTEKLDFLTDHVEQLVEELQKKSHIIQMYIMREETGALSSNSMEMNKLASIRGRKKIKAELSKHGGIMASVYGSKALDENMTLEMSLEINRKFQAVLEDTLLKNITLKENIDTLGREIARLTMSNRRAT